MEGKLRGVITEKGVYCTARNPKEHFYRKAQGYPISTKISNFLKSRGVEKIQIIETRQNGSEHKYECYVSEFDNIISFQEAGFDEQKCIPLRWWKKLQ